MKKLVLLLTTLLMAQTAIAGSNTVRTMGTVTSANPNYMRVQYTEQVQDCWQEQVQVRGNSRPQAGIAGGIVQGGVGSVEGAVGAIIGGIIGGIVGFAGCELIGFRDPKMAMIGLLSGVGLGAVLGAIIKK